MNLGELFAEARQFGRVNIFTMDDGFYFCSIKFDTIEHVQLKADSGFKCQTPENAVRDAIKTAKEIVDSIAAMKENISLKAIK